MEKRSTLILTGISFILLASFIVSAQGNYQYGMMDGNNQFYPTNSGYAGMMGGGYGMMGMMQMMSGSSYVGYNSGTILLSWITYLLTIALMIAGIYWLVKTANRKR